MNINQINNQRNELFMSSIAEYDSTNFKFQGHNLNTNKDSVEISKVAQELQEEPQANSGKDELNVTKSNDKLVIHFDNSAILNRTVQRGYLEVNDRKLTLSDSVKKRLLFVNEEVTKSNKRAFLFTVMKHTTTVAKQQSDALKKMGDKQNRMLQTASRIMQGKKVSQADEQELMRTNPELYSMAKSAAMLKKHKRDKEDENISKQNEQARINENQPQDYSFDSLEYELSETQMTLSINESELEVYSISAGTIK